MAIFVSLAYASAFDKQANVPPAAHRRCGRDAGGEGRLCVRSRGPGSSKRDRLHAYARLRSSGAQVPPGHDRAVCGLHGHALKWPYSVSASQGFSYSVATRN